MRFEIWDSLVHGLTILLCVELSKGFNARLPAGCGMVKAYASREETDKVTLQGWIYSPCFSKFVVVMRKCFFISLAVLALFAACKKDATTTPPDVGYGYFPDNVGHYVIYEGDSISYKDNLGAPHDTFHFLTKEVIESVFTDNEGRPTLRIHRYTKWYDPAVPYSTMPWMHTDIWAANRTSTTAEKIEENIRYVRLTFPVKKRETWNGNAHNYFEPWDYEYESVDKAETVNSISFDSVTTVLQNDVENLVDRKYGLEKYAKNVGLIYKEFLVLEKQPHDTSDYPPYNDTMGVWFRLKVVSWGTE